ncbi:hypothetical protein [Methylobacterium sp. E-066]|uniref:hypothetical protein n=1 Tax=Methylobacterium sp. E-066 TaxID=2836584 RepID=UPI001FBAC524|nr:hypothetical protein [Methylobacterium sp. E-066]MCJ2142260.1 hypothetical protein [Methylobacterium sp. E-066]
MDEWISLARAFEMMLVSEIDPLLVESLLVPALWHGEVPAISRRALVEGKRIKDLKLVTNIEWRWEESPIIFDWANSRAWSPAGFNRHSRETESVRVPQIDYYVIEVEKEAIFRLIPELRGMTGPKQKIPGRPNVVQVFGPEIERRAAAQERYETQTDWANVLIDWYREVYGKEAPPISTKRITNHYGKRLNQLKPKETARKAQNPK